MKIGIDIDNTLTDVQEVFIDDQLNNCIETTMEGIQTIRISNDKENIKNIKTVCNWKQIYEYVQKISDME